MINRFTLLLVVNFTGTINLFGLPDSAVLRIIAVIGFIFTAVIIMRRMQYTSDEAYCAHENYKWKFAVVYLIAIGLLIFSIMANAAMTNLGIQP